MKNPKEFPNQLILFLFFSSVITGSCLVLILALIAALFIWRMMWVRQKRLDEDFECKLTSGSRLSSDDASLIDVGWEESGGKQNSFSIYK